MKRIYKVLWFKGRINQLEYTISLLTIIALFTAIGILCNGKESAWVLLLLYPVLTQGAKRCQDQGINGFMVLHLKYLVYNFFRKSAPEANKYDDVPTGIFMID